MSTAAPLTGGRACALAQVLNCNSYDVATHAAIELQADKFICVLDGLWDMKLGQWLPLTDAESLINSRAEEARLLCCLQWGPQLQQRVHAAVAARPTTEGMHA